MKVDIQVVSEADTCLRVAKTTLSFSASQAGQSSAVLKSKLRCSHVLLVGSSSSMPSWSMCVAIDNIKS